MTKREYILSTYPAVNRASGTSVREVKERTDDGPWHVILTVANYDAMDVLDALRDAYQNGREDHAEDTDVQAQEHWQALKGWLTEALQHQREVCDRILRADSDSIAAMAAAQCMHETWKSALAKMTELEAGK